MMGDVFDENTAAVMANDTRLSVNHRRFVEDTHQENIDLDAPNDEYYDESDDSHRGRNESQSYDLDF